MALSDAILKLDGLAGSDTLQRVVKTVVEAFAAQAALYTTVVPNPPSTQVAVGVAGGAGAFALAINLVISWALKTKNARLDRLAAAIDKAVDARLAAQNNVPTT